MNKGKASKFMALFIALLTFFAMSLTVFAVDEPELSLTSTELIVGETLDLNVDNASQEDVVWKSAKDAVATVDKDGVVKAVKAGSVKIKATVYGKTMTCTVKVSTDAKISATEAVLTVGATETLTAILPDGSLASSATWTSNKKKIATVENGVVKAVKAGSATITAKVGKKKHTCKVTVLPDIRMTQSKANLYPTEYLELKMIGGTADSWTSNNSKVATVKDGVVQGVKPGSAKITAKVGKKKYTCTVKVENTLDKKSLKISAGFSANVNLLGDKIASAKIEDSSIASVTTSESTGTIKAIKQGNTKLLVSAAGKKKSSYECIVRVVAPLTVKFDTNGGSAVADITAGYGEKIAKPADPAKEGFNFGGWYVNKECTVAFDFDSFIYGDMTVYAKWNPITYTVKFVTGSGSAVESQIVGYKGNAVKPADPTWRRHVFVAWYTDEACTTVFDFATVLSGDITLYAQWREADIFDITFNTNGGSEINPQAVYDTECAVRPRKPVKENYKFIAWFTDEACTAEYDFATPVTKAFTLYAKWEALVFTWNIEDKNDIHEVEHKASVEIAGNAQVASVSYNLITQSGEVKQEGTVPAGNIRRANPAENSYTSTFDISGLMLEDGANTLKIYATAEGSLASGSLDINYESGQVFSLTKENGDLDDTLVLKSVSDNKLTGAAVTDGLSGDALMVSNVFNLYFKDTVGYADRLSFVEDTLGAVKVGELNAINMMQARFTYSETSKNLPAINGFTGKTSISENTVAEMDAYAKALAVNYSSKLDDVTLEFAYKNEAPVVTGIGGTNDPWTGNDDVDADWWLDTINAAGAWSYDSEYAANDNNDSGKLDLITNIKLGVVDNGFYTAHDDLGKVKRISLEATPENHGTHVAGIIAATADNEKGIAGVTYNNATVLAYDASNAYYFTDSAVQAGLVRTVETGAKVVNFSMGATGSEGYDQALEGSRASKWIGKLLERGYDFVVVQSAGNSSTEDNPVGYNMNGLFSAINADNCYERTTGSIYRKAVTKNEIMSRILIVGATGKNNARAVFSNTDVENGALSYVNAPGVSIYSTVKDGYGYMDGTSMAAPVVTAVSGLVWAINPALDGAEVVNIIRTSTTETTNVIDARAAADNAYMTRAKVYGTVVNATTGISLENARITVRKDNTEGEIVEDDIPINNGTYTLSSRLPAGNYCVIIKGAEGTGFAGTHKNFHISDIYKNVEYDDTYRYNIGAISLSDTATLTEGQYRIVLHWGTEEEGASKDLDSHFTAMTDLGTYFHAFYLNRRPSPAYADLDVDDVTWEGPETITIRNIEGFEGMRYAIHDFTYRDYSFSNKLAESNAYVELYRGTEMEPYAVFYCPQYDGTVWEVFSLDANGNFIEIGDMSYESSPLAVLSHWYPNVDIGDYDDYDDYDEE